MTLDMHDAIATVQRQAQTALAAADTAATLQDVRNAYLGRKGAISELFKQVALLPAAERSAAGQQLNMLKSSLSEQIDAREQLLAATTSETATTFDIHLPAISPPRGALHPLTLVVDELCAVFRDMGFSIVEGPEIENEYYNFEALNIPAEHPARDGFDTFYLTPQWLLRSHTSPVQVRAMERLKPPLQIVVPGKVYRPDATDARHSFMFHQVEGLMIDRGVSFAHLKGSLELFIRKLCGPETRLRFRPSFFPFTEPSAEVDITCIVCAGAGCRVCGGSGWLEVLGAGMVHPQVLKAGGIDSAEFSGFAFGVGVERLAMLKYGIEDIRLFYENDMRFIRQFS